MIGTNVLTLRKFQIKNKYMCQARRRKPMEKKLLKLMIFWHRSWFSQIFFVHNQTQLILWSVIKTYIFIALIQIQTYSIFDRMLYVHHQFNFYCLANTWELTTREFFPFSSCFFLLFSNLLSGTTRLWRGINFHS